MELNNGQQQPSKYFVLVNYLKFKDNTAIFSAIANADRLESQLQRLVTEKMCSFLHPQTDTAPPSLQCQSPHILASTPNSRTHWLAQQLFSIGKRISGKQTDE